MDFLRGAFVKQGQSATWATLESLRYPGPEKLLRAFYFKSKLFSLLVELKADIWVAEGNAATKESFIDPSGAAYVEKCLALHKGVSLSEIPWHEYDIVISILPLVPDDVIAQHPDILWCYLSIGHTTDLCKRSRNAPYGLYDLFLYEVTTSADGPRQLPASVGFPYPTNSDLLKSIFRPKHEPIVFLDTRLVKRESLSWFEKRCDLPVRCAANPATSGAAILSKQISRTHDYLSQLSSCKYFLTSRKANYMGQAVLEAAALDLIVIAGPGAYPSVVCHKECLIPPLDLRTGIVAINRIEKNVALQQEVLAHQRTVLQDIFWKQPVSMLWRALKMKRT